MSNAATVPQSPREETLTVSVLPDRSVQLAEARKRPRLGQAKLKQLKDITHLQALAIRDCDQEDTTPAQRAALMRAYCDLSDRRRVILGQPLPGQLRPEKSTGKKSIID